MPGIKIVDFTEGDLPFGKKLTDREGWGRTARQWRRMLRVEPFGFVKATLDGSDAGIAGLISYGKIVWIHSVIVPEEHRGKGVGRALMKECIVRAWEAGADTVRLDSIGGVEPFYASLGFMGECPSLRMLRAGGRFSPTADIMSESDLESVISFDKLLTRMSRGRILESIFRDNPDRAFVMRDDEGIRGYILGSPSEDRVDLGPCVCRPGDDLCASLLLQSAMSLEPGKKYRTCVGGKNTAAIKLMRALGFQESLPATRMWLGRRFVETESNYAMISPAEG